MDDSENNNDTEKPNATKKHDRDKQHDADKQHEDTIHDATNQAAPGRPQSSHSPTSTTSPNSTKRVISSGSDSSGSSNDSLYDHSIQVPQGSLEHLEMRASLNAAMRVLGRTRTRDAMVTYSIGIVDFMEREDGYKKSTAGDLKVYGPEMHDTISKWLDHLSTLFERMCALKIRMAEYKRSHTQQWQSKLERLEGDVLEAQKSNDSTVVAAAEFDLQEYRRSYQEMGKFTKNYEIHYERCVFQLAATLAHECFHVLTGFWTGFVQVITPPKFSGPNRYNDEGEAGEWWAYKHGFNGSVELVWNTSGKGKDDPYPLDDENMSAGVPFLKQTRYRDDGTPDGEEWTQISHTFIKDFIKKGKSAYVYSVIDFQCTISVMEQD
ncbi:hypothetical protein INS49_012162 [Diaporthe citri]|uniref:uncharacterized protein n=1 Tax=Diaporthe citri TaxID=83186 RepID=UPI001C814435|nr:uncharacterized protein INS49_012162 [Diaporthe citri]KAG6358644.1 hypothetical protein INS49_012162 [Diaporthe citri]